MGENEKKYVGGDISAMKIPVCSTSSEADLVVWGQEAWKFLKKLKTKSSGPKKSGQYDTILKKLEKELKELTKNSDPSTGLWIMSHDAFNKSVFSKILHEYYKKGKDTLRVEKVKDLRDYYKEHVEKKIAGLTTDNNENLAQGIDNRNFDGLKMLVFRGEVWEQIPPKENDKRFQNLESLKKLVLGPEVKKIGEDGFANCKNLKTIEVEGNSQAIELEKGAFKGCTKVKEVKGRRASKIRDRILAGEQGTVGAALLSASSKSKSARESRNKKS